MPLTHLGICQKKITSQFENFQPIQILPPSELFNFRTVASEEVRRVLASLPLNKSPGPDKVSARILKDCLSVILGPYD